MSPFFTVYKESAFQHRKPLSLEKTKQDMFSKLQCQEHTKETDFQEKRPEQRSLKELQAL